MYSRNDKKNLSHKAYVHNPPSVSEYKKSKISCQDKTPKANCLTNPVDTQTAFPYTFLLHVTLNPSSQ